MHSSFSDAKLALAVVFTPHPPGAQQSSVLGMDVDLGHAMDDVDLAELTSPPRVNHRRVRSDPSDFMRSLRADRFPEDESGQSSKRELCADDFATGVSPAAKKHASEAPRTRPPSSSSDEPDEEQTGQCVHTPAPKRPTSDQT